MSIALLNNIEGTAQVIKNSPKNAGTSQATKNIPKDTSFNIENRLVELALKGPAPEAFTHQLNIAKYQVKVAKNSWFNLLSISTNYNDQSFAPKGDQPIVYPKYFFGLTIPVGLFFTKGPEIKVAKENVKIATNNMQVNTRSVRVEVLTKYKQYLALTELLGLQESVITEVNTVFEEVEKKFSLGTATLDVFNAASRRLNEEKSKRISLNLDRDIVELEIEKMIGVPLESVIKR